MQNNLAYAGKIVSKKMMAKQNQKEKMTQEIQIHQSLQHKNVVGFRSFFEDSLNIYIVLELCRKRVSHQKNTINNTYHYTHNPVDDGATQATKNDHRTGDTVLHEGNPERRPVFAPETHHTSRFEVGQSIPERRADREGGRFRAGRQD